MDAELKCNLLMLQERVAIINQRYTFFELYRVNFLKDGTKEKSIVKAMTKEVYNDISIAKLVLRQLEQTEIETSNQLYFNGIQCRSSGLHLSEEHWEEILFTAKNTGLQSVCTLLLTITDDIKELFQKANEVYQSDGEIDKLTKPVLQLHSKIEFLLSYVKAFCLMCELSDKPQKEVSTITPRVTLHVVK